ncbi:MAG: hypothetical protein V4585_09580 [Bacteroidota bacterium]
MKKKNTILITLLILIFSQSQSFSQSNNSIPKFNYKGYGFEGYVYIMLNDSLTADLNELCIDTYGSVKFSFDEKCNISNITYSSATPKKLAERLEIVLKKSNVYWDKESILKIDNTKKEYLLPFRANFTRGKKCVSMLYKNNEIKSENEGKLFLSFIFINDFEKDRDIEKPFEWYRSMNSPKFDGVVFRPILLTSKYSH